jgi:hypothetical protein
MIVPIKPYFSGRKGGRIGDMYGTGYLKNDKGEFILTSAGNYIADNNLIKNWKL